MRTAGENISREYMIQGLAKELMLARVSAIHEETVSPTYLVNNCMHIAQLFVDSCEQRLDPLEAALVAAAGGEIHPTEPAPLGSPEDPIEPTVSFKSGDLVFVKRDWSPGWARPDGRKTY